MLSGPWQNFVHQYIVQLIQFFLCGIPAQRNTERTVHDLGLDTHGFQNVTAMTLCAGTAGADADAVILQNVDGVLGGDSGNGEVQNMRSLMCTVDHNTVKFT